MGMILSLFVVPRRAQVSNVLALGPLGLRRTVLRM
jgi:hypothetical protein